MRDKIAAGERLQFDPGPNTVVRAGATMVPFSAGIVADTGRTASAPGVQPLRRSLTRHGSEAGMQQSREYSLAAGTTDER